MAKDGKSEANVDRTCVLITEVLLVMKLREHELEEHEYPKNNFPCRNHWLCITISSQNLIVKWMEEALTVYAGSNWLSNDWSMQYALSIKRHFLHFQSM